jgi:IS605 OrfB family transposase
MFKTARFKVHNPSRHKSVMLWYAMTRYHLTLKDVLEKTLAIPDLAEKVSDPDKKGKLRPNKFTLSKLVRTIAPRNWELSPLRDYLISEASAMILSHLNKAYKGENESSPPKMPSLDPMTEDEFQRAYGDFADPGTQPTMKREHRDKIDAALSRGETQVAGRLTKIYANWAVSRAAGQVLRKLDGDLPHPIEFTHTEFGRGCLLAFRDGNYYMLVRLFAKEHKYRESKVIGDGFIDRKTRQPIAGKKYPGLILPLEMDRRFHEQEYLTQGSIQSAKLVVKRRPQLSSRLGGGPHRKLEKGQFNAAEYDFYVHAAFEFRHPPVEIETFLGVDRGAAKLGAATVVDREGKLIESGFDLDGSAFAAEMRRFEARIVHLQKRGIQRSRRFSLRGKRADAILGEYANRIVAIAEKNRSQIVIEAIRGTVMGRFLKQSQFAKLKQMLTYKAERLGLPAPVEVPAAYTSQTCAQCGHKDAANRPKKDEAGRALQDVFRCVACGYAANADSNASRIIALRGLHQLENGGKFKKFDLFQQWLREVIGRDGSSTFGRPNQ